MTMTVHDINTHITQAATLSPSVIRTTVKIPSAHRGWNLDAWKCLPAQRDPSKPCPVIIMAHGFTANKHMGLYESAEVFCSAGYGCIIFDYRRWGESDGSPRNCVYVTEQLQDYRTVIKWARQQPEFDPQNVVLWGSSFSGAHVLVLGAELNLHISAIICQCPHLGGSPAKPSIPVLKLFFFAFADLFKQALGLDPIYIRGAAPPGEVGALTNPGNYDDFSKIGEAPEYWPNRTSASSILEVPFYFPATNAKRIKCPVFLSIPNEDNICPPKSALKAAKKLRNVQIFRTDGGHFGSFPPNESWKPNVKAGVEFLKKHVPTKA